jgi:SseB protein N-terminal domain
VTDTPPGSRAPRLDSLVGLDLLVPIRSSSGAAPDPERLPPDAYRHGVDESGSRFIAAFSDASLLEKYGPPGSDHVRVPARELFERAEAAGERVVVDPGAPSQVEVAVGVLPFLAAGIDPNRPDALRARRPVGGVPALEPPDEVPEPFGSELLAALADLIQVERAWLLRAGDGWTAGIELVPGAVLGDFDAVRNRLHAVATEHLGTRRALAVTDLRAPALREQYDTTAAPFYVRRAERRGFLGRLFGD